MNEIYFILGCGYSEEQFLRTICYSEEQLDGLSNLLFRGTVGGTVPPNNLFFGGTVGAAVHLNNLLFGGTVGRAVPLNNLLFGGTLPNNLHK